MISTAVALWRKPLLLKRLLTIIAFRRMRRGNSPVQAEKYIARLIAAFPQALTVNDVIKAITAKPPKRGAGRTIESRVQSDVRKELAGTCVELVAPSKLAIRQLDIPANQEEFVFDVLRFRWRTQQLFPPDLPVEAFRFRWIDEADCQTTCPVAKAEKCVGRDRQFRPIEQVASPERLREIRGQLKEDRFIVKTISLEVVESLDSPVRGVQATVCKARYSDFKATNYERPQFGERVPLEQSPLANQLGITACVVQLGADGQPVRLLLSVRQDAAFAAVGASILQVGHGRIDAAASSQIKLYDPATGKPDDRHHSEAEDVWALPSLRKAVDSELELEAKLDLSRVVRRELLALGSVSDRNHPEVLVLVETTQDLEQLPLRWDEMHKLNHGKEFRYKVAIPFRRGELATLARYLLGYLDELKPRVPPSEWMPEAAVGAILTAQRYFGRELEQAFEAVVEGEMRERLGCWEELAKLLQ